MTKFNLAKLAGDLRVFTRKHQPEILTGLGVTGMVSTVIMAIKATPKALDRMEEVKAAHAEDTDKKAFCIDVLRNVAPVYIPTIIIGGLSISCIVGASSVNYRRNAALATAYALSESALKEYQEKVVETIGDKKEEAIRASIAKDRYEKEPIANREIYITKKGKTKFYDPLSGRYFESDIDALKKIENELNRRMRDENEISLNEFYYEIGLPGTELGEIMGWSIERGYIDLDFIAAKMPDDDNELCFMVGHNRRPDYRYR